MTQNKEVIDIGIFYKPKKDRKEKTRLFGEIFIKNNKDKAKIIFNGNEYELTEIFEDIIHDKNKYEIKLTLRIFGDIINLYGMFLDYDSLYSFPDDDNIEENLNNNQQGNILESKEQSKNNNNYDTETNNIFKKRIL